MTPPFKPGNPEEHYRRARQHMVQRQLAARGISDPHVLDVMARIPRHRFVSPQVRHRAYDDRPLPIGSGQTISQPYIVALMTQLLELTPTDRVLEIGVGSGYQTAILAELVAEVIGVERIPELAERARCILAALGYDNVTVHVGDGSVGSPAQAPYDSILAAAAAPRIPEPLIDQLADGGRLVLPVGGSDQTLVIVRRMGGQVDVKYHTPVRFVPMIGRWGLHEDDGTV